jgi:hypothetical protein
MVAVLPQVLLAGCEVPPEQCGVLNSHLGSGVHNAGVCRVDGEL